MTIVIEPAPDRTLDFAAVRRALSREGVRPGRMILVADGTVSDGHFSIDGWPGSIVLTSELPGGRTRLRADVLVSGGLRLRPVRD